MLILIFFKAPKFDNVSVTAIMNDVPKDWWLTSRRTINLLAFKIHRDEKEFTNLCTGHRAGISRAEQHERTRIRTEDTRVQERERSATAIVAVERQDPNYIRKQQLEEDVVGGLVARTRVKNDLDKCNATKMKLDMLQTHKETVIARHGEDEYNRRVNKLIDKLLEDDDGNNEVNEANIG